jgi:hypothetical protein
VLPAVAVHELYRGGYSLQRIKESESGLSPLSYDCDSCDCR